MQVETKRTTKKYCYLAKLKLDQCICLNKGLQLFKYLTEKIVIINNRVLNTIFFLFVKYISILIFQILKKRQYELLIQKKKSVKINAQRENYIIEIYKLKKRLPQLTLLESNRISATLYFFFIKIGYLSQQYVYKHTNNLIFILIFIFFFISGLFSYSVYVRL